MTKSRSRKRQQKAKGGSGRGGGGGRRQISKRATAATTIDGTIRTNTKAINGEGVVTESASSSAAAPPSWTRSSIAVGVIGVITVIVFIVGVVIPTKIWDGNDAADPSLKVEIDDSSSMPSTKSSSTSSLLTFESWTDLVTDTTAQSPTAQMMKLASSFTRRLSSAAAAAAGADNNSILPLHPTLQDYIEIFLQTTEKDKEGVGHVDGDNKSSLVSSFDDFLEGIGETSVNVSRWQPSLSHLLLPPNSSTRSATSTRNVTYFHPVQNPLAPPWARSIKHQTLEVYDPNHLAILTTTEVHDVPKADCFVVEDRLLLSIRGEKENENDSQSSSSSPDQHYLLEWSSYFRLNFHKSTMFRSMITKSTTKEYLYHWTKYKEYVEESLDSLWQHQQQHNPLKENGKNIVGEKRTKNKKKKKVTRTTRTTEMKKVARHAYTLLPWLSFTVGKNRPLLSI